MTPALILRHGCRRLAALSVLLCILDSCVRKSDKGFGGLPADMREQFARTPALYFEKDGKSLILTLTDHRKIISYSRKGNSVQKQAVTTYYIQTNDAVSAARIAEIKIKEQAAVKTQPVELIGASGTHAWAFVGEPMAFDAFTLQKKADLAILEQKNPVLTGKFPQERRYYHFDPPGSNIYFTATDGSKWELNTTTLLCTQKEFDTEASNNDLLFARIEEAERKNQADLDSLYQQKDRTPSKQYAAGQISSAEYNRIAREYRTERELLNKTRDSLRQVKHNLQDEERSLRPLRNNREHLASGVPDYSDMRINQDTLGDTWYGLYSPAELSRLNNRLLYNSEIDETARRRLYVSTFTRMKTGEVVFDKEIVAAPFEKNEFLHAGFLLDKRTALPLRLRIPAFLVVHKDKIGREGTILLSLVQLNGKSNWTLNTGLKEWADWIFSGDRLFLFGTNHPELSSGQVNVLLCIDILSGKTTRYDYDKDKVTSEP